MIEQDDLARDVDRVVVVVGGGGRPLGELSEERVVGDVGGDEVSPPRLSDEDGAEVSGDLRSLVVRRGGGHGVPAPPMAGGSALLLPERVPLLEHRLDLRQLSLFGHSDAESEGKVRERENRRVCVCE